MLIDQSTSERAMPAKSSLATGIIAFGVVMAICYVAASVIETLLVSLILAIFLDPIVELLRRARVPRALGAFIVVVLMLGALGLTSFFLYTRVQDFASNLPRYSRVLRENITKIRRRVESFQKQTEQVIPRSPQRVQTVTVTDTSLLSRYLFPGVQTAASFLLVIGVIPFLVFFMLSWKDKLQRRLIEAFAAHGELGVANGIRGIASSMRSYLIGNIIVGLILSAASTALFYAMGLQSRFVLGLISGFLSLVPYIGILLAIIGPVLVALPDFHAFTPYIILIGSITVFHILAMNILFPKLVGSRVNLNPVAVTIALLMWGWMWGGLGLLLAIPITAGTKAVCDNIAGLEPIGKLLGEY